MWQLWQLRTPGAVAAGGRAGSALVLLLWCLVCLLRLLRSQLLLLARLHLDGATALMSSANCPDLCSVRIPFAGAARHADAANRHGSDQADHDEDPVGTVRIRFRGKVGTRSLRLRWVLLRHRYAQERQQHERHRAAMTAKLKNMDALDAGG